MDMEITEEMLDAAPAGQITELCQQRTEQRAERFFRELMLDDATVLDAIQDDAQSTDWLMTLLARAQALETEQAWRDITKPLQITGNPFSPTRDELVFNLLMAVRLLRKHVVRVIDDRAQRRAEAA